MNLNARCQSVKELFQNHLETCSSVFLKAKLRHDLAILKYSQKVPKSRKRNQRNILITPNKSTFRDDKQG